MINPEDILNNADTVDFNIIEENVDFDIEGSNSFISRVVWGGITGNLSDQEDLQEALDAKANANDVYTKLETDELLDLKADEVDLTSHINDKDNPHEVTKEQIGLSNVDNTSDLNKPISNLTQAALDLKANSSDVYTKTETNTLLNAKANESDLISHEENVNNPHRVTKAQVGLENVDNTSDLNKPISTATQSALNLKANEADLESHINNKENPHEVTKTQVGLGNVDNTSDINKPISNAVQNALNLKADKTDLNAYRTSAEQDLIDATFELLENKVTSLSSSSTDTQYPSAKTVYDDAIVPIDTINSKIPSQASSSNQLADKDFVNSSIATNTAYFKGTYDIVDDLHLTVTATHEEVEAALDSIITGATNNDYCFVSIPSSQQPGDVDEYDRYKYDGTGWSFEFSLNNSSFTVEQWAAINSGITSSLVTKLNGIEAGAQVNTVTGVKGNNEVNYRTGNINITKDNIGLSNVDNTSDINKPISTAMQTALDLKANQSSLEAHINNTSNPHNVTKSQIGLGNVDNTSDVNKPISTATQTALNGKVSDVTVNGQSVVNNMIANVSVPTKTSDLNNDSGFINLSQVPKELPTISVGDAGKSLVVNSNEDGVVWENVESASYTAGTGIDITNKVISVDNSVAMKTDIPTVNNATLTIQKNGTTVKTFTANASSNVTANITVPTKVSELTNDSGYTTNNGTVTSVTIKATSPIEIDSSSAITSSGTRTISHATSGATAGSYGDSSAQTPSYGGTFKVPYVTVDTTGHVTNISEHTVKIPASDNTHRPIQMNGTQVLGDNTTPLNLVSGTNVTLSNDNNSITISSTNTDTKVKQVVSSTNENYPILLKKNANTTTETNQVNSTSTDIYINPSTGNLQITKINDVTVGSSPKFTDTTYESKSAASGGTAVSLVTTGEKYTWNNKQATLVSGTNIKTINGNSILGSGNLSVSGQIITGTLIAGNTSITITDSAIKTNSILSFYASIYDVSPETVVASIGSVTLTFEAQSVDMIVGVSIDGEYSL